MFARYRHQFAVLGYVGAAALFSNTVAAQSANNTASEPPGEVIDEVIVSGFRASLQNSVEAKRGNIAFTDSIYAEDIGKFPDLNLAESLQRIPGVQIARDFTGEGTSVAVRGLGKDFTQITLNGSPVETASDSNIDSVSQGRGIDLVLFPTELFSKLTVSKTPVASQTEGAVAANIDLRIARPFDEKGFHVNYSAKGSFQESSEEWSPRLGFYASNTWDTGLGEFGILGGVAYSDRSYRSDGFNTIGFTTVGLGPRCPFTQAGCNTQANPNTAQGYGNSSQAWPTTVPAGYSFGANGATAGDPLTVCGPGSTPGGTSGLSCNDLSYSVWPRLARPDSLVGERETTSGILAMQWAPSENLSFFFDSLYSEADHVYERNDLNLAVRSTNTNVPVNVELDDN
jgi:TonB-dependent receptor